MNQYFERNVAALAPICPALGQLSPADAAEWRTTPTGAPSLRLCDHWIHSVYDPEREAEAFAAATAPGSRVFLYGFGLGYHVAALLEALGPEGRLVVVELNPTLMASALGYRDWTALAGDARFHLVFGQDEAAVTAAIARQMEDLEAAEDARPLEIRLHTASFQCFPDGFPRLRNALDILLMERRVPAVFGGLESVQYALNREQVAATPGLNRLKGAHRGRPAVLVSAGPSLDGLLPYLSNIRRRAVLGCVDTALPVLAGAGLDPDYVFTLDAQEASFQHFSDHLGRPFALVYLPTANARILRQHTGPQYVVFKKDSPAMQADPELAREKGLTDAGGSVSCLGLDALIQMGCGPVFLVGQDCAFSAERTYSRQVGIGENQVEGLNQTRTLPQSHRDRAGSGKRVQVDRVDGSPVVTDQVLYSYLRTLEQVARSHPEVAIYNLCSHGARIEHVQSLGSVSELITLLPEPGTA